MNNLKVKKRNVGLAGFLSLFLCGLGQLYNGQFKKGLFFFLISLLLPFTLLCTPFALSFKNILWFLILVGVYRLYVTLEAGITAQRLGSVELRWFNRWYVYLSFGLLAVFASMVIKPILYEFRRVDLYRIPTPGMSPTLLVGDHLVADKWFYEENSIALGDIVIFSPPYTPNIRYTQRCVAVEGDTIEVRSGVLYLNNEKVIGKLQGSRNSDSVLSSNQFFPGMFTKEGNPDHFGPIIIPEGKYFLMGDMRDNSEDSRFFGPVDRSAIYAKVIYLYYSWDRETNFPRFERIGSKVE